MKVTEIKTIEDAKVILDAMESGKDRGHMQAKMGGGGIPNSSSGYDLQLEREARYVLFGNMFLEQTLEKIREMEFPSLSKKIYIEKKKQAEIKFAHLKDLRSSFKKS